jgi:hypothetical protein
MTEFRPSPGDARVVVAFRSNVNTDFPQLTMEWLESAQYLLQFHLKASRLILRAIRSPFSMTVFSGTPRDLSREDPLADLEARRELRDIRQRLGPGVLFIGCDSDEAQAIHPPSRTHSVDHPWIFLHGLWHLSVNF